MPSDIDLLLSGLQRLAYNPILAAEIRPLIALAAADAAAAAAAADAAEAAARSK